MRITRLFAPALFVSLAGASALGAQAARDIATASDSARRTAWLGAVSVTATRSPSTTAEIAQRVRVVGAAELANTPGLDVADVLKRTAGVDVVQYPSLLAGVGIRGFRPETGGLQKRTLILVDGRPSAASNIALLDLAGVERIEVLKGAASALYGSSAEAGVVNIITRRSLGERHASLSAAGGSFSTSDVVGRAGGRVTRRVDADLDGHLYRAGGAYRIGSGNTFKRALGAEMATRIFPDGRRVEIADRFDGSDRNGARYRYASGAARLGVDLGAGFRAEARADALDARNLEVPGDIHFGDTQNSYKDSHRGGGELSLRREGEWGSARLRVYQGRETGDFYNSATATRFVNFAQTIRTSGAQLETSSRFAGVALTAGVDATRAEASSGRFSAPGTAIGTFSPNSRNGSLAGYAQGRASLLGGRLLATAGGRLDEVRVRLLETPLRTDVRPASDRFVVFNPSGGLVAPLAGGLRVHASAGRGFVTPDAFSRAGLSQAAPVNNVVTVTVGNPGLRPEHAVTLDGGIGVQRAGIDADLTVFSTAVRNRITTARANYAAGNRPTTAEGYQISRVQTSVNAGSAAMRGVEAALGYDLGAALRRPYRLRVGGEYTRLLTAVERVRVASLDTTGAGSRRAVDPATLLGAFTFGAETEAQIRNVARATVTGSVEYDDFSRFRSRFGARYVGRRRDSDFSDPAITADVEYPPFLVLDLTTGMRVAEHLRADVVVSNLTDENYYEKRGYNLPGRALQLRLTASY